MRKDASLILRSGRTVAAKEGIATKYKVLVWMVTFVWWLSPFDDFIPTLLLDEILLTVAAFSMHAKKPKGQSSSEDADD